MKVQPTSGKRGRTKSLPRTVIGVDGCTQGWVAVSLLGETIQAAVFTTFDELLAAAPEDAVIAVDMPIGLVRRGSRAADSAVRTFLGARRSSLFLIPPREVVAATEYAHACAIAKRISRKGISRQAFGLFRKIRELDQHARDQRIIEVHPETSFTIMAGAPLKYGKKSWAGSAMRRDLLTKAGLRLPKRFHNAVDHVGVDDVLDATAAAWSGRRWLRGEAREFPDHDADIDVSGRRIVIAA